MIKVYVGSDDIPKIHAALESDGRAVAILCKTKANCRGLGHGEPVVAHFDHDELPGQAPPSADDRAAEIVAGMPVQSAPVPADAPSFLAYGTTPLNVFLAALERTLRGEDPPAYVPPETWWRWVPAKDRFTLAQKYVVAVERAEEPTEGLNAGIPWAALKPYLGV